MKEISKILTVRWQENGIRYFGVQIGKTNKDMVKHNVISLVEHLRGKCGKWMKYP